MNLGGAETYVMSLYRCLRKYNDVQFDFAVYGNQHQFFEDEIHSLGGNIYYLPDISIRNEYQIYDSFRKIINNEKYAAVHCHTNYNEAIPLLAAKTKKIPVRIAHSHNTKNYKNVDFIHNIYMKCSRWIIVHTATHFLGCSNQAMIDFYGNAYTNKFIFAPDAINVEPFYDSVRNSNRNLILEELNLPLNNKIIGHVGNFGDPKNHQFIISTFKEMLKIDKNMILILIGNGEEREIYKYKQYVNQLGISEKVFFLGRRTDIPTLMSIMDLFIFPSLYEGFGIVLLEAQATGLHCLCSENIQPEADLGIGLLHFHKLDEGEKNWAISAFDILSKPKEKLENVQNAFMNSPFLIKNAALKMKSIYFQE